MKKILTISLFTLLLSANTFNQGNKAHALVGLMLLSSEVVTGSILTAAGAGLIGSSFLVSRDWAEKREAKKTKTISDFEISYTIIAGMIGFVVLDKKSGQDYDFAQIDPDHFDKFQSSPTQIEKYNSSVAQINAIKQMAQKAMIKTISLEQKDGSEYDEILEASLEASAEVWSKLRPKLSPAALEVLEEVVLNFSQEMEVAL